jgi:hypothetical protein
LGISAIYITVILFQLWLIVYWCREILGDLRFQLKGILLVSGESSKNRLED